MRRFAVLVSCAVMLVSAGAIAVLGASVASASTGYSAGTPVLDTVSGGPWNSSQGDPSAGGEYPLSDLLPSFTLGGPETTLGGVSEPNVAVYPAASGAAPYPSGVAGTPGPLDGYCSSLGANPETGSPVSQPAKGVLPFAPYYFPDVVRNADGSLTGYFDYRPKDANEAITVARSTDNGATWTTEGEALQENRGYCPTADTNDDGQGHPYVGSIGGSTKLYTLQRPAGDYENVGLLVHNVEPAETNPLGALPASEPVGVDPNTFATASATVPTSGGETIPVSTLGSEGSPEHIVPGPYEDLNAASPSTSIITCSGTSASPAALTGCTVAGGKELTVNSGDDLVQVIATANPEGEKTPAPTYTIPAGPNKPSGEGGLATFRFLNANSAESPITTYVMNINAPNRIYVDGVTVHCVQANANPTTKLEFCTTQNGAPLTVKQGDAITSDPIIPASATMTSGLLAPDGIVGTLPSYPGAPEGSTVVLYTEKILNYFVVGRENGSVSGTKYTAGTVVLPATTINYTPSVTASEPLPASGSFSVYMGAGTTIQQLTCTGSSKATQTGVPAGSYNLTGCSGGTGTVPLEAFIGGPGAAIAPISALEKIGEGKSGKTSGPEKLFGNNEDYTALRAAYTTNGIQFTDLGAISGSTSGTGNDSGSYNDISNPFQQTSPSPSSPTNLAPGSADTTELRYVGSRGTIVTNPDGSYGMFLSGSWATDGDSDAFNQIFYSSSTNGKEWSVPSVVTSTDYTFSASAEQDRELAKGVDAPLGISAYYSGRAYGPSVVQGPSGKLTMIFSGYRLPKPVTAAGTVIGTTGAYTIGAKDPAIYRNILTATLSSETSPRVTSSTSIGSSDGGSGPLGAGVTYQATVAPVSPGTGTPTGTVAFSDSNGPIAGCAAQPLRDGYPDSATCTTTHEGPAGADEVTATYSGDSNYATSSGQETIEVTEAPAMTSADEATFTEGTDGSFTVTATGTPKPAVSESGALPEGVTFNPSADELSGTPTQDGVYSITFTAANGTGANAVQKFTLTVDSAPAITSASSTTFDEGAEGSFTLTATGTPKPGLSESGALPEGVTFDAGTGALSGTATQEGVFPVTFTAANGVGSDAVQKFTLTVDSAPAITSAEEATFTEGSEGSFTLSATGTPAPALSESGTLPRGVTFDSSTGKLIGTPTQEGTFQISFTASNGNGPDAVQSFLLTVDAPPAFTSASAITFSEGSEDSFEVAATGTPRPSVAESGTLPEGVSFNPTTDELAGTPTQDGTYQITFTASNGIGAAAVQKATLTVQSGPAITSADAATFTEGSEGTFSVQASGTPAPALSESGALPNGVTFDSSTGELAGTPTQDGTFQVTFKAANGVGTEAVQSFTLTVDSAPAITSAAQASFLEGSAGSFTASATGNPQPTLSESGTLPEGVSFDAATGELAGTPTQAGSFPITLTANNGVGADAVQKFTLTVDAAPVITSAGEATFTIRTPGSFEVTDTSYPAATLSVGGGLPQGVSFDPSTGKLSGTPTAAGTFQLTVRARNGIGAEAIQHFTLKVLGLHITTSSLPDATLNVPYSHQLTEEGGYGIMKWKLATSKSLPPGLKLTKTGLLEGTVKSKQVPSGGSYTFTVSLVDQGIGLTVSKTLTLQVNT